MKKTKIAVGVVIALGVIWTGGAWLTGKQIEKNMDQLIQLANKQIRASLPESHLQLSYQDYQRGLFSSQVQLILQPSPNTEGNVVLKSGQRIQFQENIDHGPFPLAQLKKFNLTPSMASIHSELANTDLVKTLFDITKGQSIVQAETRLGYDGSTDTDARLLAVDYTNQQSGERILFSGGTLAMSADSTGDKLTFTSNIDTFSIASKNALDIPILFTINGLTFDGNSHLSPEGLRVGSHTLAVTQFVTTVDGKTALTLNKMKGNSDFDSKQNRVSGQINYSIESANIRGQEFGGGKLKITLADFDGSAIKQFSDQYNSQLVALTRDQDTQNNPEVYQQHVGELLANNLPLLLKGNPSLTVSPLSWTNEKGESSFNLNVRFKEPDTHSTKPQNQQVGDILQSLEGKLQIAIPMATELMSRVAMIDGHDKDSAAKLADQQIKGLAAMGQMFQLTTQQDNNILATLQYADQHVTLNGEKMPLEQFLSRYMLSE